MSVLNSGLPTRSFGSPKPIKRKRDVVMKYKKGIEMTKLSEVTDILSRPGIKVFIVENGSNTDGTNFLTITIDGFKPK